MSNEPRSGRPPAVKGKRPYRKPSIELVETHGDQVLATGCKTSFAASGEVGSGFGCTIRNCGGVDGDS